MIRAIACGLAFAAVLAGCGDDGPTATPEQNEAIARLIDAELTDAEQRCVLEGLIETGIAPSAILADEITADEDTELIGVTVGCIEDLTRIPAFLEAFIAGVAAEGTDMTEAQATCALELLESGDPAAAVAECLPDQPTADDDEFTYGDDAVFDLLWDSCASGNNLVCDELAATAPAGSGYEVFGRTCAQRLPEGAVNCFDELG